MGRQSIAWDSPATERRHAHKRMLKYQRIQGLIALLETWQDRAGPDCAYIRELKLKIRSAEEQLEVMKP